MSASEKQVEAAREAVAPVVAALGCRLYDIEVAGSGPSRILRVTIDRDGDGGVDIDTIAEATRAISPALDEVAAFPEPYLLEVSSPGIERALRRPEHFRGAGGAEVSVKYHTEAGPRRVRGVLVESDDTHATVDVDGDRLVISLADITSARTVFEWGPPPRENARARAKGVNTK